MRSDDEIEIIGFEEMGKHISTEKVTDPSLCVLTPSFPLLHWICPEKIAKHALVWYVSWPIEREQFLDFQ